MTIDRWTEIRGIPAETISLKSDDEPQLAELALRHRRPAERRAALGQVRRRRRRRAAAVRGHHRHRRHRHPDRRRLVEQCRAGVGGGAGARLRRRPVELGAAVPACRDPGVGRALRDHGSADHRRRPGRSRHADRLRRCHDRAGQDSRRRRGRGAVRCPSRPGQQCVRASCRRMRGRGGRDRSVAHAPVCTTRCRSPIETIRARAPARGQREPAGPRLRRCA